MSFFWYSNYMFAAGPSEEFVQMLANPETQLEQVLDLDETLSQARRRCSLTSERLIALISILVDEPPAECSFSRGHKLPFTVSEMLSSGSPEVLDKILAEPTVLERLFSYLDVPIANLTSAAYFCGTLNALISHSPGIMFQHIYEGNRFPLAVVKNLKSRSMADLLFKILFMDSSVSNHYLLERFAVLKELVLCMEPARTAEEQANASIVLCDLIRQMEAKSWKILICSLIQKDLLEPLFVIITTGHSSAASAGLAVLNTLLACESLSELSQINLEKVIRVIQWSEDSTHEEEDSDLESEDALIPLLLQYLPLVLGLLRNEESVVGPVRLQICELVDTMLKQRSPVFDRLIIDAGGIREIVALFFKFPVNSLLQKEMESVVRTIMEKSSEEAQRHLILEVDFPQLLASTGLSCKGTPGNSGLCHIGFITRISNYLISRQSDLPWWSPSALWEEFVGTYLEKVNKLEKQPAQKRETEEDEEEPEFNVEDVMGSVSEPPSNECEEVRQEAVLNWSLKVYPLEKLAELCRSTALTEASPKHGFHDSDFWKLPVRRGSHLDELE